MHTSKHQPLQAAGRLSAISLAVAAALTAAAPMAARAQLISGPQATTQSWVGGDLLADSAAVVSVTNGTGVAASTNPVVGTLTNNGTIKGTVGILIGVGAVPMVPMVVAMAVVNNRLVSGTTTGITIDSVSTIQSTLSNSGTGTISGGQTGIYNQGSIGTLSNSGTISGTAGKGIYNISGQIDTLSNSGAINGGSAGIMNTGRSIGTLSNSGTIRGIGSTSLGISNDSGTITALTNSIGGNITGGAVGIYSGGMITALTNSGTISGSSVAISNTGTIGTLTNNGAITASGSASAAGINNNGGTITALTNNSGGVISGGVTGITNSGTIGTLTNSGTITGSGASSGGISNSSSGTISTLTNSGAITSSGTIGAGGIGNSGTISTLTNSGTISASGASSFNVAIFNVGSGTIGALANSGTISGGSYAIYNDASSTIGTITNAGVIAGNIQNLAARDLTVNGGTGSTFGTLTGYTNGAIGGVGTITNTASNVVFSSGNLVLNDNINVGTHAVNNTGATLQVNAPMSITGNYTQGAGATLLSGVSAGAVTNGALADTGYGRLVVSGSAVIAAGSSVGLTSRGYAFAAGQRYVVVDAATAGTSYNEGSLRYSAGGFNGSVTGQNVTASGRSDLVLTLGAGAMSSTTPTSSTGPATDPNAISALSGLGNYSGLSPALLNLFNAAQALNQGTSADANRAGAQLSPAQSTSATGGAAAPIFDVLGLVGNRADSLRLGQADSNATGIATGESPMGLAAWGQAFGGHANQSTRDQVDGYGATYGGLMLGADKAIGDAWRAGGVFSYSNTLVEGRDNSTGDSTRVNGYGLTGYASYTGKPWYVNMSGGVVQQRYNTNRAISFTGFSGVANGSFSGQQYVARAEGGYPLAVRNATLTPLASLTYSHLNQNSYTETGGNGAALAVGATHATSLRSSVGAKLEQGFETAYGKLVPEVQLQWVHEFNRNPAVTAASFAADPTGQTAFTTVGATPVSNLADLTLGVTLLRANNLSLTARYELQLAKGFVSQTGSLRLHQLF